MSEQIPPPPKRNSKPPKKMSKGVAIAYALIIGGSALAGYELYKKLKPSTTTTSTSDPASSGSGYWSPGTSDNNYPYDYGGTAPTGTTTTGGTTGSSSGTVDSSGNTAGGGGTTGSTGTGTTTSFWDQLSSSFSALGLTLNPTPTGWTTPTSTSAFQLTSSGAVDYYKGLNQVAYPSYSSAYLAQQPIQTGAANSILGMLAKTGGTPYQPNSQLRSQTTTNQTSASSTASQPTNSNFINQLIGAGGIGAIIGGAIAGLYNTLGIGGASSVTLGTGTGAAYTGGTIATAPGSDILGSIVEGASSLVSDVSGVFGGGAVLVQSPTQYTTSMNAIFGSNNPIVNAVTSGYSTLVGGVSSALGFSNPQSSNVGSLTVAPVSTYATTSVPHVAEPANAAQIINAGVSSVTSVGNAPVVSSQGTSGGSLTSYGAGSVSVGAVGPVSGK